MTEPSVPSPFILKDSTYTKVKWLLVIMLPALGTLYFAFSQIWGLPAGQQVLGSIFAVQAFLGVILGVSSVQYNASDAKYDGEMHVIPTETGKTAQLVLNKDPEELVNQKELLLKKIEPSEPPK